MEQPFEYYAFISYKREDERWAKWLQRKIENFRLPAKLCKEHPELPKKLQIFKDTSDLQAGVLSEKLEENLCKSKYLIVVCSPKSAKSGWVGKEIEYFIELGKADNILLFIVEGKAYSNNSDTDCIHQVIKEKLPELLGANINEAGEGSKFIKWEKAFARLLSSMLGISFDAIWQRQKRAMIQRFVLLTTTIIIFISALGLVWNENQPFDMEVKLNETTYHNENLPFENGIVQLIYDNDTLKSEPINNLNEIIEFKKIAGKYKNKPAQIIFEMFGFAKTDTVLKLSEKVGINVGRDETWGVYKGFILDENLMPIENAEVIIEKYYSTSDKKGFFEIIIPLENQAIQKLICITKKDYQKWEFMGEPAKDNVRKIMLEK